VVVAFRGTGRRRSTIASRSRARLRRSASQGYPISFFHVDIAEVQTAHAKLYLFVAVDSVATQQSKGRL
jgi:hypothetical protein